MPQLYTVKMTAKKIICSYDSDGKKKSERVELIPQVYHDLPHVTAIAYKTKFPDNDVQIIAQAAAVGGRDTIGVPASKVRSQLPRERREKIDARANELIAEEDDRQKAARTGDMTAAINAELGS